MTPTQVLALRTALGLTQVELAERIGVSSTTIQGWERGRKNPSRMAIKSLESLSRKKTGKDTR